MFNTNVELDAAREITTFGQKLTKTAETLPSSWLSTERPDDSGIKYLHVTFHNNKYDRTKHMTGKRDAEVFK